MSNQTIHSVDFLPVQASLADFLGEQCADETCRACSALTGEDLDSLREVAFEPVDFLPVNFLERQHELLKRVGERFLEPVNPSTPHGATTRMFDRASRIGRAPLSALGLFRLGEDGRLYLISKSEHYHTPLGHSFPGYALLERARRLGIPNATHNNTRGRFTRILEEELVAAANGLSGRQDPGYSELLSATDLYVCNRVLNLETGSLAVEAALKMMLARFYRVQPEFPDPKYSGRIPVFLVMGSEEGGLQANYHGTTVFTQTMRGMWADFREGAEQSGLYRVQPIRPNCLEDMETAFSQWESGRYKIAGFLHEIVMMNYGGRLLTPGFLQSAYRLCRQHDVPTLADEIQSCMWHHDFFMVREWNLTPSFLAVGKGFPGGEYPASRLLFSSAMDCLPQFGALVTNGQEEMASLAYLVTMRWARENAEVTQAVGDFYENRLRGLAAAYPETIRAVEGRRHMSTVYFHGLDTAQAVAGELNRRGLDISSQTYKADCPPALLTKVPLIATTAVADFIVGQIEAVVCGLS